MKTEVAIPQFQIMVIFMIYVCNVLKNVFDGQKLLFPLGKTLVSSLSRPTASKKKALFLPSRYGSLDACKDGKAYLRIISKVIPNKKLYINQNS